MITTVAVSNNKNGTNNNNISSKKRSTKGKLYAQLVVRARRVRGAWGNWKRYPVSRDVNLV